jgi:DNA-binding transcriptional LysR family regulator
MSATPLGKTVNSPSAPALPPETDHLRNSALIERFFRSRLRLSQLRLLVAIADQGQLKRVADQLNVTPSTISKQVAEIEDALQRPILERVSNHLEFTEVGALLAQRAREMLDQLERTRIEVDRLCTGEGGSFGLGAAPSVAALFLPSLVLTMKRQSPNSLFRFQEGKFEVLAPMLEDATLDIVLARETNHRLAHGFVQEEIMADPVVVVCGKQHTLASRDHVEWKDLAGVPWILPLRGSLAHVQLEALMRRHGLPIPPGCVESISLVVNIGLLQTYPFVGLFPLAYVRKYLDANPITILPLSTDGMEGYIKALWRRDNGNPMLERMVESIRRQARQL